MLLGAPGIATRSKDATLASHKSFHVVGATLALLDTASRSSSMFRLEAPRILPDKERVFLLTRSLNIYVSRGRIRKSISRGQPGSVNYQGSFKKQLLSR